MRHPVDGLDQSVKRILLSSMNTGPVTANKIAFATATKDTQVREAINQLRSQGEPIVSSTRGYEFTYDPSKIRDTVLSMRGRIEAMQKAIDGLIRTLAEVEREKVAV